MRSRADFKAQRDKLGLSLHDVAELMGVQERSVRRWEAEGGSRIPEAAWKLLNDLEGRYNFAVMSAVEAVLDSGAKNVELTYYRNQREYDEQGRDEGPHGLANAIAREVALELKVEGVNVSMRFPEERGAALEATLDRTRE